MYYYKIWFQHSWKTTGYILPTTIMHIDGYNWRTISLEHFIYLPIYYIQWIQIHLINKLNPYRPIFLFINKFVSISSSRYRQIQLKKYSVPNQHNFFFITINKSVLILKSWWRYIVIVDVTNLSLAKYRIFWQRYLSKNDYRFTNHFKEKAT